MKLRQKLAVALATAMVITSVPVVTMAASTNSLTKEAMIVAKDTVFNNAATAPQLKVELKDYTAQAKDVFYLSLENSTWNHENEKLVEIDAAGTKTEYTGFGAGVQVDVVSDTVVKVTVDVAAGAAPVVALPLLTTVKDGDAKVSIKTMGSGSSVTTGDFLFATTSDKVANVTIGEVKSLYTSGEIADIVITESVKDAFKTADGTQREIELTLNHDDFEFVSVNEVNAEFSYGFAGAKQPGSADLLTKIEVEVNTNDKQVMKVKLPNHISADSIGQITLKGIQVKATTKTPETGDLTMDIAGKSTKEQNGVVVAKVVTYGNTLSVKDDKAVEILAGQSKEVEFTLSENIEDSMVANREVEFKLDKGYFALEADDKDAVTTKANLLASITSIKNDKVDVAKTVIQDTIVEDGKVIGFTMKMPASNTAVDKFIIKAKVYVGLEESGEITLSAEGRSIGEQLTKVVVNAKQTVKVSSEKAVLKVGLKGQEAGKITITETEKAMIKKGQNIEITLPSERSISFAKAPEVKVTGDLQIGKVKIETVAGVQKVIIPVTRESKTASTIEILNFVIDTDRTVAEGAYDVEIGGLALTANADSIKAEDFITIGTPNTEDLGANGLQRGTSTFVIGESKYTVNGVEKTMDAASYIQDPGFTMVPMRYVAEAFGVQGNNILFSKGVTTIFAGSRTIQLTNGSDIAVVNGVQIKMATKVVIKDGRTYAPIGEVAQLLGVSKTWDNTTKTATFTNR